MPSSAYQGSSGTKSASEESKKDEQEMWKKVSPILSSFDIKYETLFFNKQRYNTFEAILGFR